MTRKLAVFAAVAMTLMLAGCTSSTSPAVTKAANAAQAAARSALKAETAARAAAAAAEKAAAAAEAAELAFAQPCTPSQLTVGGFGNQRCCGYRGGHHPNRGHLLAAVLAHGLSGRHLPEQRWHAFARHREPHGHLATGSS